MRKMSDRVYYIAIYALETKYAGTPVIKETKTRSIQRTEKVNNSILGS